MQEYMTHYLSRYRYRRINQLIVFRIDRKRSCERKVDEMIAILKITLLLLIFVSSYAFYRPPRALTSPRVSSTKQYPEKSFIEQEFSKLSPSGALTYERFFQWNVVQELLKEKFSLSIIFKNLWETRIGDVNSTTCNLQQFAEINKLIDIIFDKLRDLNSKYKVFWPDDVWDPTFDPLTILKPAYINSLKLHFADYSTTTDQLSYTEFFNMNDIKGLIQDFEPFSAILNDIWTEAFERIYITRIGIQNNKIAIHRTYDTASKYKDKSISFDTYMRLLMRIEGIIFLLSDAHIYNTRNERV